MANSATIALTNTAPNVLVVTPSLPVKSVTELIALAKAKPGALNYSTSAVGGSGHLAAELFNVVAGASAIPSELRDIGTNLGIRGWLWWRRIALPAVFPFYVTGVSTPETKCIGTPE